MVRTAGPVVACLGMLNVAAALAAAPAENASSLPADTELTEITVTAQRRSEGIEKAPVAITAVSPQEMTNFQLKTIDSVQFITPGLIFDVGLDYPQNYIRGVGTQFANPGLEPPVATYVDGAYQARALGTAGELFDLGNVQILKGPQGTLYGRNATGGAILINTADPTHELSFHTAAEGGNLDHLLGEFTLNIPATDTLDFRIGARESYDGGYIHNLYDGELFGSRRAEVVRGKARWAPNDSFNAVLSLEYSGTQDFPLANATRPGPCFACSLPGGADTTVTGFYDVNNNTREPFDTVNRNVNLRLHYATDRFAIDNTAAFVSGATTVVNDDQDHSPLDLFDYYAYIGGKTYTEDVQLLSSLPGWINFLVGGSYLRDEPFNTVEFTGSLFQPLFAGLGNYPQTTNELQTTSYAGFGEIYLTPIDKLKVTVGGRYTYDKREIQANNSSAAALALTPPGSPAVFSQSARFHAITPRAVFAYDLGAVNVYASYNRGFKAGGYNSPIFAPGPAVGPEQIDSYELGAKFVSADRRVRANLAVFHYNYRDIQVSVTDLAKGITIFTNAGAAKANGFELDGSVHATESFDVLAGLSWLDATYTTFPNASIVLPDLSSGEENLSGAPLDRAPKWSGFVGPNLNFPVPGDWQGRVSAVARYTSRYVFNPGAGGPLGFDYQPGMLLANMTAAIGPADKKYEIGLFVNNLTNKEYHVYRAASSYGLVDNVARPRTYGIRVSANF